MSFGSLGGAAITALNKGAAMAGALQNTGEGGISPYHLNGGDLVWQIGTGYFGCRNDDGTFSLARLDRPGGGHAEVRAIEIKLSQGAKPGLGGMLPGAKVTPEIAAIRGIPVGVDCTAPPGTPRSATSTGCSTSSSASPPRPGLPVGIKSAVGEERFWHDLADAHGAHRPGRRLRHHRRRRGRHRRGAAGLHRPRRAAVQVGFSRVYRTFAEQDLHHDVVFIGSGKLGLPENALLALALGCDMINVARKAMLSIGCIQAQRCHTGRCPTGVATQSAWLQRGLDPALKSVRCANYLATLRFELLCLARACGYPHPALVPLDAVELLDVDLKSVNVGELFDYRPDWGMPGPADIEAITTLMAASRPGLNQRPAATGLLRDSIMRLRTMCSTRIGTKA